MPAISPALTKTPPPTTPPPSVVQRYSLPSAASTTTFGMNTLPAFRLRISAPASPAEISCVGLYCAIAARAAASACPPPMPLITTAHSPASNIAQRRAPSLIELLRHPCTSGCTSRSIAAMMTVRLMHSPSLDALPAQRRSEEHTSELQSHS